MGKWKVQAALGQSSKESFSSWCPHQACSSPHLRCLRMPALGEVSWEDLVEVGKGSSWVGAPLRRENFFWGKIRLCFGWMMRETADREREVTSLKSSCPFSGFPVIWPDPGWPMHFTSQWPNLSLPAREVCVFPYLFCWTYKWEFGMAIGE